MNSITQIKANSLSIVLVTSQLRQREIKMAYAMVSLGWSVNLIYYDSTPFRPEGYFSSVKKVKSASEAHYYAQGLAPDLVHVFSGAIDEYILLFCQKKIAPVVIDLNDVFTPALMDYCPERFAPTKEALALADGYCARDLQVKYAERSDNCKLPPKVILFPEFCWNKAPASSQGVKETQQEIHIVSVGTISLETHGMYDCCYLQLVQKILNLEIHFHMYPPWCYRKDHLTPNVNFEKDYGAFLTLAHTNPFLHIHDSLPAEELFSELKRYDFGIVSGGSRELGQRFSHFRPSYVSSCYSGRISDYLDAGLPVLINEEVEFNYWLLKRYGIGVDLKGLLQPNFKKKLQALKHETLLHSQVQAMATKFSISQQAPRLARFYAEVIASSPLKRVKPKAALIIEKISKALPIAKMRKFFSGAFND